MTKKKRKIRVCCAAGLILLAVFAAVYQKQQKEDQPLSVTAFKLNTIIKIDLYDCRDETLLDEAVALCDQYEKLFSRTLSSSEIYKLNAGTLQKKGEAFVLSSETADLVSAGLDYCKLSDGAFDITIEPVSSLWDFTSEDKKIPDKEELEAALPLVNYKNVVLENNTIQFLNPEMGLDLGAIAKGYIADRIKEFLVENGVKSAVINLGGNVLCIGSKPDGTPFRIGIQKPFADQSETAAIMDISDKSVVSSGIYERYFEQDGKFYHHILNPKTGYSYDNHLVSVTIICDKSVDGDGLSTSCFALGLEKGMELVNRLPDVQAVFITDDYELHYSRGFTDKIPVTDAEG